MKLLFVTRKFPPSVGGMEIYSSEIDVALRRIGADIELVKPPQPVLGRPSLLQMAGFFLHACTHIIRKRKQFDALLIGDFALASLACLAKLVTCGRVRVAVSLHGQDLYFMRQRSLTAFAYRALARCVIMSGAVDVGIANSRAIREEATRRGLRRVSVVPLATALPASINVGRVDPPYLLFAGRLIRYKGLSWFVEQVWPRLDPRLALHVAGEVWDASELACLDRDPRIHFLGRIDHHQLPALREAALACIMPNLPPGPRDQDEGFGLSALEASAVGTPIVATRTGGLPDAIVEDVTGYLIEPLDVDAWVARLNAIAVWTKETRADFGVRARAEIASAYNWDLVARRTLALLDQPDVAADRPADGAVLP